MHRAVTHIHTGHSWDSRLTPAALVDRLVSSNISLALVSDHDSFAGALQCRAIAATQAPTLQIPVAAEIRTDEGDVIVVFEDDHDLPAIAELKNWDDLVPAVRSLGGLVWLPHPYHGHLSVEKLAAESDVIEVFNARCSPEQNAAAVDLCRRHQRVAAFSGDVHLEREIDNVVVTYHHGESVIATLRRPPTPVTAERTRTSNVMAAELANGLHRRRPALLAWFGLQWAMHRTRELTERRP